MRAGRRPRREDREEGRLLHAPVRRRAWRRSTSSLTNPEVLRATLESGGENLLKGLAEPAGGPRARQGQAAHHDDRPGGLPGRREHRGHARQGRLPERPDRSWSSTRRRRTKVLQAAAADHPALDQQVLHPRPAAEKNSFIRWAVGAGPHGIRRSPGSTRTRRLAAKSFEDYMLEGPLAALDAMREGDRRAARSTSSATASAARCSPATLAYMAAKNDTRIASATYLRHAWSISPTSATSAVFIDEEQLAALEERMNENAATSKRTTWRRPSTCCAPTT